MNNERPAPLAIRLLKGFAMFWWDFLIGDTPELFVAALVMIGIVALVRGEGHLNFVAVVALPVLAVTSLVLSVRRATKGH